MTTAEQTAAKTTGSAAQWGPLWGARPAHWAVNEEQQLPTYEEAIARLGLAPGHRVLDVGCGTGVFLRLAADRGAGVSGIDASEVLIAIAAERVPEADLGVGEMQSLPYEDDAFDAVTGFNSFFFAAEMTAALAEAGRVAKPGAPVLIQVWGAPERCDIERMKSLAREFMPPPPGDRPAANALWPEGVLEEIAEAAGLEPQEAFDVSWAYEFDDAEALGQAMMSAGGISKLVGPEREPAVRERIVEEFTEQRTPSGGYRLENEFHFLLCRARSSPRRIAIG